MRRRNPWKARAPWKAWICGNSAKISCWRPAEISRAKLSRIGILALQGDVTEHVAAFSKLGLEPRTIRTPAELEAADAIVIPGGESTTVIKLLDRAGLSGPLAARVRAGMPLWGTCMGMIVASAGVDGSDQPTLGLLNVTVRRNAFGRQASSAEMLLDVPALGAEPFPAVFIRAPWIERAGAGVEVLAAVDGHPVFVREGHVMGTSFHPELTGDTRVHEFFASLCTQKEERRGFAADLYCDDARTSNPMGSTRPQ